MEQTIESYSVLSIGMIPERVLAFVCICVCAGGLSLMKAYGKERGFRYSMVMLLFGYIFLLFSSTVFFRIASDTPQYNFVPFWSYVAAYNGEEELVSENLLNVVVFIPIGLLVGLLIKGPLYSRSWMITLLIGLSLSLCIETLQFVLKKGFSEIDDVIHNTIGFFIGGILWTLFGRYRCKSQKTKRI